MEFQIKKKKKEQTLNPISTGQRVEGHDETTHLFFPNAFQSWYSTVITMVVMMQGKEKSRKGNRLAFLRPRTDMSWRTRCSWASGPGIRTVATVLPVPRCTVPSMPLHRGGEAFGGEGRGEFSPVQSEQSTDLGEWS